MRLFLGITLPLYALDQLTKWLVLWRIHPDETIPVIPDFFYLVQVHNTGAAFGMLRDNNGFFIVLSMIALIALVVLARRGMLEGSSQRVAGALLAAGILGNLTDRLLHRYVIDFLLFILPVYGPWPAFNVADSCICVSAAIFMLASVLGDSRVKAPA